MNPGWSKTSLIFLFIVALIGTMLRSVAFLPLPLEYVNLVHAHSHVAFQGWVYTCMMLLLTQAYLTDEQVRKGRYALQFVLTVIVVAGILISFSIQGYAFYSILFSTLFQLLNYWFIFRFLRDVKKTDYHRKHDLSLRFVKTGLWFGLLSTLLPIGIGLLSARGQGGSETYRSLVYTFLHLQYNGWFLFVALGLFYRLLDRNNWVCDRKEVSRFYNLLALAVIPSISLSLLGMEFSRYLMPVAYVSSALLGGAIVFFIRGLPKQWYSALRQKNFWFRVYIAGFVLSFAVKMILQTLSVLPPFQSYASYNKFIIIAYLHLSLIGSISFLLLALLVELQWVLVTRLFKIGSLLFISGFAVTETLLVLAGLGLFYNDLSLSLGSGAMALGVLLMVLSGKSSQESPIRFPGNN